MVCGCAAKEYKIFCQYDLGAYYYKNSSKFKWTEIDLRLCTHLVYGTGVGVDGETGEVKVTDEYLLFENDLMSFSSLIRNEETLFTPTSLFRNEKVDKVLGTIGGWPEEPSDFSKIAASSAKRERFVETVIEFIYEWRLDGIQIDWRYPTQRGGKPGDRMNFVKLLKELKSRIDAHGFILMVAVLGRTDKSTLDCYDIPNVVKNVHFVNLMFHDNRDPFQMHLGYNAPLAGKNNVIESIMLWKKLGKAPAKLIMNIPLFVRSYLRKKGQTDVGSRSKGPGLMTNLTNKAGFMTYNEWCPQAGTWMKKFDEQAQVPYAFKGDHWISYENDRSISAKMMLLKSQNLGGAMAWTIDSDDFTGKCGKKHSLERAILAALEPDRILVDVEPTTPPPPCPEDGLFPHSEDCQLYYGCSNGQRFDYECPWKEFYDAAKFECRPMKEVKCERLEAALAAKKLRSRSSSLEKSFIVDAKNIES
ncbi:chitinase-3-like protein 1 [Drosophila obscura]|uniref:chitinase-3-like protein 1 n=1 Tax=Drosophila obscura TaxID=7282 RepID=UPI001BB17331|nr:chitinase-3-like protein 1 [Drosophila obscura]